MSDVLARRQATESSARQACIDTDLFVLQQGARKLLVLLQCSQEAMSLRSQGKRTNVGPSHQVCVGNSLRYILRAEMASPPRRSLSDSDSGYFVFQEQLTSQAGCYSHLTDLPKANHEYQQYVTVR